MADDEKTAARVRKTLSGPTCRGADAAAEAPRSETGEQGHNAGSRMTFLIGAEPFVPR